MAFTFPASRTPTLRRRAVGENEPRSTAAAIVAAIPRLSLLPVSTNLHFHFIPPSVSIHSTFRVSSSTVFEYVKLLTLYHSNRISIFAKGEDRIAGKRDHRGLDNEEEMASDPTAPSPFPLPTTEQNAPPCPPETKLEASVQES